MRQSATHSTDRPGAAAVAADNDSEIAEIRHVALGGEPLDVDVRLILAPVGGVFRCFGASMGPYLHSMITQGHIVGAIAHTGGTTLITSWLSGLLMEMLVAPGERVHARQPVAWVRALADTTVSISIEGSRTGS